MTRLILIVLLAILLLLFVPQVQSFSTEAYQSWKEGNERKAYCVIIDDETAKTLTK